MKTVSVKQIQELDRLAIEDYGIPSIVLMENAGREVAAEVIRQVRKVKNPAVCIVCGLGNNAGDGFVAARYLISRGIKTRVFLAGRGKLLKDDAAVNHRILKKLKCPIRELQRLDRTIISRMAAADVVIDAVFGIGLNREVRGLFRTVIEAINQKAKCVVSVDIPSGLDGTTGGIYGVCVKANKTVTFSFPKKGFFTGRGPRQTGKVFVVDIGIPSLLKNKLNSLQSSVLSRQICLKTDV